MDDVYWQAIALLASGSISGLVLYTNKNGRIVTYVRTPPTGPPSAKQIQQRARFTTAQAAWSALSAADKAILEQATHILSLPLTGQNLYIRLAMQTNPGKRLTIIRQTGLSLPAIPYVPFPP